VPAIVLGAGIAGAGSVALGFAAAVVVYAVLTTGYTYGWARLVGSWAERRSRRG
jgi:hypothetical protein